MSEERTHGDLKFFIGLFLGGVIGALIIFFLGTKEGKKTGKFLEEKGKDALDDLKDKVEALEEKGKELVSQGKQVEKEVMHSIVEKKEELTEAASEKLDSALAHIEHLQEQSLSTTAEIRKRYFKNLPKKR